MSHFSGGVSVVIPAYRVSSYIVETLQSVFAQTTAPAEVIVVNDGCPDTENLERALAPFRERIQYLTQPNRGAAAAKNTGIRAASQEWIATIDADDRWRPEYLAVQTQRIAADPSIDVLGCDAILFGETPLAGTRFSRYCPLNNPVDFRGLVLQECNVFTSALSRKRALLDVGIFDESVRHVEDFDLWVRLTKAGARIVVHSEVLADYRVRAGSLTSNIAVCRNEVIQLLASYPALLSLSPAEREVAATASRRFHALLDLHVGKQALRQGDFAEAQLRLAAANRFLRNPKTAAFVWMLKLSPGFAAGAERWLRRRAE